MERIEIPLFLGNGIEILGIIVAITLVVVAPDINDVLLRFLAYLLSWGCLVFFPHCLAHFVTGRLVGVRFTYYLVSRSPVAKLKLPIISEVMSKIPILGLKIDRSSLSGESRWARGYVRFRSSNVYDSSFLRGYGVAWAIAHHSERRSSPSLNREPCFRLLLQS